jgi:hypothetical protein
VRVYLCIVAHSQWAAGRGLPVAAQRTPGGGHPGRARAGGDLPAPSIPSRERQGPAECFRRDPSRRPGPDGRAGDRLGPEGTQAEAWDSGETGGGRPGRGPAREEHARAARPGNPAPRAWPEPRPRPRPPWEDPRQSRRMRGDAAIRPGRAGRTGRSEVRLARCPPAGLSRGDGPKATDQRHGASRGMQDSTKARGGQAGPPPGRATGHRADPAGQQAASTRPGPQVRPAARRPQDRASSTGSPGRGRLRRKQPATQHVSRRLAYPLALLPGVQQEL